MDSVDDVVRPARFLGKKPRGKKMFKGRDQPALMAPRSGAGDSVGIPAGLIDPYTVYRFRFPYVGAVSSSAAGILSGFASLDPMTTTFGSYSSIVNLFSEIRLVEAQMIVVNANPHSDGYIGGTNRFVNYYCWDDYSTGSAPSSSTDTMDRAKTWTFNLGSTDSLSMVVRPRTREWASTATPSPGPYAGCTGFFGWYKSGLTVSTSYFDYVLYATFEFRNRQ